MMKKYFFLPVLLFACFTGTSFAQLKISNPVAQKAPLLQIPVAHITPAESLFVPVHIDLLKPYTVSLGPVVFGERENAACAHFKALKPTLVLKAEAANNVTTNLEWETKYAFYATGFDVERSLGDSLHFVTVNFKAVSKATNFKIDYHLPDRNDYSGLSFYRIRQRNGDSAFVYSNIVSIKGNEAEDVVFRIYPIPASDRIWIDAAPKQNGNAVIMVFDPAGKLIQQQSTACRDNGLAVQSIDISKLAAGLYQLRIVLPDKTFLTGKFIKK